MKRMKNRLQVLIKSAILCANALDMRVTNSVCGGLAGWLLDTPGSPHLLGVRCADKKMEENNEIIQTRKHGRSNPIF